MDLPDEGATCCPASVLMVDFGKQNQDHEKHYSALIRHKDVMACGFGAIGFYLFHQSQIMGESFPDFTEKENWFHIS
jgi:hypothetical protein